MATKAAHIGDFSSLREAFNVLTTIYSVNGIAAPSKKGVTLSGIPREQWAETARRVKASEEMVKYLVQGSGQRSSVQGRLEVVLAVIALPETPEVFEISALLVKGRGAISKTLTVSSDVPEWRVRLRDFVNWSEVSGIVAAAEGNNQRAMIGLVLQLAGIGRGKLEMIEADIPEEVDEAAQSVRGADWLKAGLPRFERAAGEALWYLMRIRSVHARMIRVRKQGYYTSMALAAMYASGMSIEEMSSSTGMSAGFVEKLTPQAGDGAIEIAGVHGLGGAFQHLNSDGDERRIHCINRVWKGAAIYAKVLDRRIRVGAEARERIAQGDDIVSIARELRIPRRDLIRVLSVRQADAIAERERFVGAIIDPELVRRVSSTREG